MSLSRKLIVALAALAVAMFALSACGGDDDSDDGSTGADETTAETTTDSGDGTAGGGEASGGPGGTIEIAADPSELAYTTGDLSTKAGEVTIEFDNPAALDHDVRIEDAEGNDVGGTDVISNDSTTATVELAPGEYTYYCSVPGHRPAGMEGNLTVE